MMNARTIYFDMDGTITDLYGVENWLADLIAENARPYEVAPPLWNMGELAKVLKNLQKKGYKIGVVSWLAKNSSQNYKKVVTKSKKEWLEKNCKIKFDEMHFVKYGTRKDYIVKDKKGILFDDDERVRKNWRGTAINPKTTNIIKVLEKLEKVS